MTTLELTNYFMGTISPSEQERMRELSRIITKDQPIESQPAQRNAPLTHTCKLCGSIAVSYQGGTCLSCTLKA